ncbi:MAG: hypothetical protein ABSB82_17960 [Terriglobia bacterium]|jgi:hypothetical protein
MWRTDKGAGRGKLIFALLVLAAAAYCAIKIVPVYVSNYELNDKIRQLAIQATVDRSSAQAVQDRVLDYAKDLGLPVKRENITVQVGSTVTINVDYTDPIDLKVYTLNLHLTASAENRQI